VTTKQIEDYLSEKSGLDLSKVFDQYLRTANIPVFEYKVTENVLKYRYTNVVEGFEMPLKIWADGQELLLIPNYVTAKK